MKLYFHPISPYCQKVLVAAYEKGVEFEPVLVNLFDPEARKDYIDNYHPYGKVPLLVLDSGWKIPESSIIIEYLDLHFDSGPKLIPEEADLARQARFHDRIADLYLVDPAGTLFFENRKPEATRDNDRIGKVHKTILTSLALAERHWDTASGGYVLGETFTMADISAMVGVSLLSHMGFALGEYPQVVAWHQRVTQRESWQRIQRDCAPYLKLL